MQCRRAEDRIQSLLDERVPLRSDAALARHLAGCPDCRRLAAGYERLATAFSQPSTPEPRLTPASRQLGSRHGAAPGWGWRVPAALAAGLACLALWTWQSPWLDRAGDGPVALTAPPAAEGQVPLDHADGAPAPGDVARATLAAESAGPAQAASGAPASISDWLAAASMTVTFSNIDQLTPTTRQWVEPVSGGFKPVTRSMEAALGALRDSVLGPEPSARS